MCSVHPYTSEAILKAFKSEIRTMNFMTYGKKSNYRQVGMPASRAPFIPEKYWAPAKTNNRHELFFKPQREDLEEQTQNARNRESVDDTMLTIKATSFFNRDESTLYMAVTEGRGNASCEVGIAAIDIKRPELIMSQISDNFWYTGLLTKIAILSPTEILLPQALINSSNTSKLYLYIKHTYPDLPIRAVPRRQFNDKKALEIIDHIHNSKYQSIRDMIAKKYYALTASSALLQYLEYILNYSFAPNSLKLRYESKHGCMTIDLDTSHHLELLYPTCKTKEQRACLFGVLNSCVTSIGKRNLRAQILQPSCELKQIIKTQECIKELFGNQELFLALEGTLAKFHSVDKLMKFAVLTAGSDAPNASETMITQTIQLKSCLENVPELNRLLATINNTYFDDMKTVLINTSYKDMLKEINMVIHPNVQMTGGTTQFFQRLHAVNSNISSYLDLNRENYTKLVDKMNEIIGNLSATYNLPFRMKFVTSKGFHIQLSIPKNGQFPQLSSSFEILSKTKNTVNLITNELRMLNLRMFDVVQQIHIESNRIITTLVNCIRHNISHLYDLCGLISSLDIILSLTKYSINSNGCCPSFSSEMNVIDGIHPLLEYNRCKTTPVPNGVIANSEYHFFVITGPNMGGKTIYLKMIALLQILAQLGCFVPATTAQFRLTDKILSRIGFGDRIECNLSGFVLEMRETEYIFKNITPNSLVIIDELCRSTNPEEGEVLAWDICERFIRLIGVSNDGKYFDESDVPSTSKTSNKSLKLSSVTSPFIFFVTHFDSITKLQDKFLSVVNLHFSAEEEIIDEKNHLTYTYRIEDGVNQIKNYGISLAQYMNFPADVISKAILISDELRQQQLPEQNQNKSNFILNNSSINRRTTHRSTLLDASTSEHSHFLRLFYNLYADMVAINRLTISIKEKQELLNIKMKELSEELPSHVLEMAKKGNLFDMFKRSPNVPLNIWTSTEQVQIEQDPLLTDNVRLSTSDVSTDFSLLSQHSIVRRIGMELQDMFNTSPPRLPEISQMNQTLLTQQQSDHLFSSNRAKDIQSAPPVRKLSFNESRSSSGRDDFIYGEKDRTFDFLNPDINLMDHELTQYFSNLSPKEADINFEDEPNLTDFFTPGILDKNYSFTSVSDEIQEKPRSYQNTSTDVQAPISSKDYTKTKSSNTRNSQRSSSSASSGLFRLQLKEPVKVKDNRILKTPPKHFKSTSRIQNAPFDDFTFSNLKDTTQQRSTSKLSFSLFNDDDFSRVEIPTIPSLRSGTHDDEFSSVEIPTIPTTTNSLSDSPSKSFQLNLTQFCSLEANDQPFFDSSQSLFETDRKRLFSELLDEIAPIIPSTTNFRETTNAEDESFAFSDITTNSKTLQHENSVTKDKGRNSSVQLNNLGYASTSQEKSRNIFNLNNTLIDSSKTIKERRTRELNESSHLKKLTVVPNLNPSTALKFLQDAYQSEEDSATDDEISDNNILETNVTKKDAKKLVGYKAQDDDGNFGKKLNRTISRQVEVSQDQKEIRETEALKVLNTSLASDENVDVILPAPPQFL